MSNIDKAAEHLGANALKMIKLILLKHDAAIIEASQEAIEAAVLEEREACAKVCRSEADRALWNFQNDLPQNESFWNGAEQMASSCENAIRARGQA